MTEGAQWAGLPIKLETEFIIKERMVQSLALAGATLDDVVHAQVYLTDRDDYSAFNEAWTRHFAKSPPTLDIIPCIDHGLAPYDGKIEINVLALKPGGAAKRRAIDAGVPTAFRHQPQAIESRRPVVHVGPDGVRRPRACAVGRHRPAPAAVLVIGGGAGRIHHRQHRQALRSRRHVAANVVRVLQFHTDIREFYPVYKVWERRLGGRPVPFSAVEVPAPLPVPGATVLIEAWAYAP